jgi:hypothetical protein
MAILKFKDENNQWQDLAALRGRDGVIQYQAGNGIIIDGNVISAIQQDLSNYYTKSQVNDLIDAIDKVSLEAVNELPATGEPGIIYLVPSANPQTTNAKDEYIYINNAWEQIGTTAVDLSNYYTKSEIDAITQYEMLYRYGFNVHPYHIFYQIQYTPANLDSVLQNNAFKAELKNIINDALPKFNTSNNIGNIVKIYDSYNSSVVFEFWFYNSNLYQNSTIALTVLFTSTVGIIDYQYNVSITYTNNKVSNISIGNSPSFTTQFALGTANTLEYTPTADYNPATKKYVDDAVAGAGGDCLLLEFKAPTGINHMGDNNYTYTSSDLTADQLAVITAIASNPTKKAILFKYTNSNNENYYETLLTYQSVGTSSNQNTYYFTGSRADYNTGRLGNVLIIIHWNTQDNTLTSLNISTYTAVGTRGIPTFSDVNNSLSSYLSKTNTTSYTPTGNYHPATKKYVDDKIPGVATTSANGLMSAADKTNLNDLVTAVGSVSSTDVTNWNTAATNSHTHANKTLLDTITSGDVSDWNGAVTNSHTHSNKTVLDGITAANVTAWNKTHIYSGTSTPGAGTGENGDIYVKYTA